ncbi:pyridoxal 5'-phosphate synthase [Maudiozyma humilis]|uniref:Pyridoxal 5'-phosphate synthase n=1 Tax=Maudiozyma humilis TaxID=51915 RepID=A0AAV5RVM4_MAUHU|nr:pyridoxal 5'-phosphate synthase [Kazachstania humilis]
MKFAALPQKLLTLIEASKYVHIATCGNDGAPSVSLMNYIYVAPSVTYGSSTANDYIIFAMSESSDKFMNILTNPTVSMLFHDWVAANNLSIRKHDINNSHSADAQSKRLANLLDELDDAELNQISATIQGEAELINPLGPESKYYKGLLLHANPDADVFIEGSDTVLVKVRMLGAKVVDSDNHIITYGSMNSGA